MTENAFLELFVRPNFFVIFILGPVLLNVLHGAFVNGVRHEVKLPRKVEQHLHEIVVLGHELGDPVKKGPVMVENLLLSLIYY